jgi:penicillin-binding protein 2
VDSIPGADVKLTIDMEMQQAVEKALGYRSGAALVMAARTGEILALASHPNYDPNIFLEPLDLNAWNRLERTGHPFMNRGLALYPPGSIFKVITLVAALDEKLTKPDEIINCPGFYKINRRIARCWLTSGHGSISIIEGLVWSCDVVFYELGKRLGPDLLAKYAHKFGLGERSEIDLPQEKKGTIPDREWKRAMRNEPWYDGDSINYGIGQGFVRVTPLQMGVVYAAIASGQLLKPFVVKEIVDRKNKIIYSNNYRAVAEVPTSLSNLLLLRKALRDVVRRGTGIVASVAGIPAAGKTGTAENPGKAHAWFVCFAPYDNPEIVIVAFVEHGEHGDRASASIARDILTWYKENRLQKTYTEEKYEGQYIEHGKLRTPYYIKKKVEQPVEEITE